MNPTMQTPATSSPPSGPSPLTDWPLLWDERKAEPDGKFRVPVDVAALLGAEYAGVRIFVVRDAPEGMQPRSVSRAPADVEAAIADRLDEAKTSEEQAQVAADALTVRKYYEALQRWGA